MKKDQLTVAIVAGGNSQRFGADKALSLFMGRPLLSHMIEIAQSLSSRILLVLSEESKREDYKDIAGSIEMVVDPEDAPRCSLTGALTAFEFSERDYTLLLPVDSPLANRELLKSLIQLANGHGAIVPTWPNGYIEPLHSVYLTEHAYYHGIKVIEEGKARMRLLINSLTNVLGISTEVLKRYDPDLLTFSNINTEADLKNLERVARRTSIQSRSRA